MASSTKIVLAPVLPSDYLAIAQVMAAAFGHEEFGVVACGPLQFSEEAMHWRARGLAKAPHAGETTRYVKAVAVLPNGTEKIVGFASWTSCIGRTGSEEEKVRLGTKEGWAQEEREKAEKKGDEEKEMFGPNGRHGNGKLWEDMFVKGDEYQARLANGRDYMKLSTLAVLPQYQRRGIGVMLLEDGLKRADEAGLQTVLGASPAGLGLYKKYSFVEQIVMDLNLWEYDGGAGLGVCRTVFLVRPAVGR